MRVGVPTEVKNSEFRVAVTPAGVSSLGGRGPGGVVHAGGWGGLGVSGFDFFGCGGFFRGGGGIGSLPLFYGVIFLVYI
ncbi:hypothetical protein CCP2SC5_2510003 [Azospirillaceae bacterium]